jgi:hypothetical protein
MTVVKAQRRRAEKMSATRTPFPGDPGASDQRATDAPDQGELIETLLARDAEREATMAAMAAELVEHGELLREHDELLRELLAGAKDRTAPETCVSARDVGALRAPEAGMMPLKQAMRYADGYSDETVRLWLRAGLVKGEHPGGRWYVDVASLAAHVAARRRGAA